MPGPAHDKRHTVAALPDVALCATKRAAWLDAVFDKLVPAGNAAMSVVAGEDHDRVVGDSCLIDCPNYFARRPIGLHQEVGDGRDTALAGELLGWRNRFVRRGHREI